MKKCLCLSILLIAIFCKANDFYVNKLIDGDTFELLNGERVRMIGINAPEKCNPFYSEAKTTLAILIKGKNVDLLKCTFTSDKDRYGRLLRYVNLDSIDANKIMLEKGLVQCYVKYKFDRIVEYEKAEKLAQYNAVGIWSDSSKTLNESTISHLEGNDNKKKSVLCILLITLLSILIYYGVK